MNGREGEALAALWAVGARAREAAVPLAYLDGGVRPSHNTLTQLMIRKLVAHEGPRWWLTEAGWAEGSTAATELAMIRRSDAKNGGGK